MADLPYHGSMTVETTLRQRHAEQTRARIVSASLDLFEEHGFQATTVDEIAARADVAPRTFFRYFPTKEAVLFADAGALGQRIARALAQRPGDEHPFLSLTAVMDALADEIPGREREIKLRKQVAVDNPGIWAYERRLLDAEVADALADFVADRLDVSIGQDPRPRLWAGLVMTTFRVALHLWLEAGEKGSLRPALQEAFAAALEAMDALRLANHPGTAASPRRSGTVFAEAGREQEDSR
jgi:TetR/AcrR family transcriptional regulator, regulator of mycofactocin system